MFALLPLLAAVGIAVVLMISPVFGWLAAFLLKPVVDMGWEGKILVLGLTPIQFIGAVMPLILLMRMAVFRGDRPRVWPLSRVWIAYTMTVILGACMALLDADFLGAFSFLLRSLNGLLAFYLIQHFFGDRQRFRLFIIVLLIAGLFPMIMGFIESLGLERWRVRLGSGGQVRITAVYHNSTNLRYYAYLTLTAIAFYWIYFCERQRLVKLFLAGYAAICAVVLFNVYSKAAFAAVLVAGIAWIAIARKIVLPALIVGAALIANVALDNRIYTELERTFMHETAVLEGTESTDRLFAGRVGSWKDQLEDWSQADLIQQLFGGDIGGTGARAGGHNDYIRALRQTGIAGTITYVILLVAIGFVLLRRLLASRTPLNIIGSVVYSTWIIDSIGLTPAVYTNYQWYAWGFIGLAITGVRGLDRSRAVAAASRGQSRTPQLQAEASRGVRAP